MSPNYLLHPLNGGNPFAGNLGSIADGLTGPQLLHHVLVVRKEVCLAESTAHGPAKRLPVPPCLGQSRVDPIHQRLPLIARHLSQQGEHDRRRRVALAVREQRLDPLRVPIERHPEMLKFLNELVGRRVAAGQAGDLMHHHLSDLPLPCQFPNAVEIMAVRVPRISGEARCLDYFHHLPAVVCRSLAEFVNLPGVVLLVGRNTGEDRDGDALAFLLLGHMSRLQMYSNNQVIS